MSILSASMSSIAVPDAHRPFVAGIADDDSFHREALDPAPLPAEWIRHGDPSPRMRILSMSADGSLVTGIWCCGPGEFRFDYDADEIVHLISGAVVVQSATGGRVEPLTAGSAALFPTGLSTIWTVEDHVRKFFVLRHPSRPVRIARRLLGRVISR